VLDPGDRITVSKVIEFFHRDRFLLKVWHDEELQSVLSKMKKAKTHIALVQDVNNSGDVRGLQRLWDLSGLLGALILVY